MEGEELRKFRKKMGMVFSEGSHSLANMANDILRTFRPRMSLVFQDPYSSLNHA